MLRRRAIRAMPVASSSHQWTEDAAVRLLVINPNISESVTRLIEAEARRAADAATEIVAVTAPFGVAYI